MENELDHMIEEGAVQEALRLDQVRREIEKVYVEQGEHREEFGD